MNNNRKWKKTLLEVYGFAPRMYGIGTTMGNPILEKELRMTKDELHEHISFLEAQGLVEKFKIKNVDQGKLMLPLKLTTKGFNVSIDLEKHKDSSRLQLSLLIFTAMIVATGAVELVHKIGDVNPLIMLITYALIVTILGLLGFIFTIKK